MVLIFALIQSSLLLEMQRMPPWLQHRCSSKFLSRVIFAFLLFLVMVMYAYEVETKEK